MQNTQKTESTFPSKQWKSVKREYDNFVSIIEDNKKVASVSQLEVGIEEMWENASLIERAPKMARALTSILTILYNPNLRNRDNMRNDIVNIIRNIAEEGLK